MMTDAEREAFFARKKKEIIERLLGKESPYPIPDPVTTRLTAPIGKSWYDKPRILQNMNPCAFDPWLHEYNRQMHANNGRIVTIMEEPIGEVVPPPVK